MHHIIPRSLGGDDSSKNLVKLTYREHFVAHLCLVKIAKTFDDKFKMATALAWLVKTNHGKRIVNSRQFELARREFSKARIEFLQEVVGENGETRAKIYSHKGIEKRVDNRVIEWWHPIYGIEICSCYALSTKYNISSSNLIKVADENRGRCNSWRLLKNRSINFKKIHQERMSQSAKNRGSNGNQFVNKDGSFKIID